MATPVLNLVRSIVDDTLPLSCNIEKSQQDGDHFVYSIRLTRLCNDPASSWIISRRFRDFFELSVRLKELGYEFQLPAKSLWRNKDPAFIAERQKGLQLFLDSLLKQYELSNSLTVKRFLDPDRYLHNHHDIAFQHISMFIRSTNNVYQIVENLSDFGWRYNKIYYLASKVNAPKDERFLIVWSQYGLDKAFSEKEILAHLKSLKNLSHPCLVPIDEVYANEMGTIIVTRYYNKGSLKDHIHQTAPKASSYWKRYSRRGLSRSNQTNEIRKYGRKILEILELIYNSGLAYGHLHSGNLLFDEGQYEPVKLLDLANVMAGVSSKYRGYTSSLRKIRTFEQADVYGFGRILFELATGEECSTNSCTQIDSRVDISVQKLILNILSPLTPELPTIQDLLEDPLFADASLMRNDSLLLKPSVKIKEAFEIISRTAQTRFDSEQAQLKNAERRAKNLSATISDGDRAKKRREQMRIAAQTFDETSSQSKPLQRSISVDPLQFSTDKQTNKNGSTPTNNSNSSLSTPVKPQNVSTTISKTSISPPPTTSAPPPPPPPPPPPAPPVPSSVPQSSSVSGSGDRSQLLTSISGFDSAKLKKAKTNDRSAPKLL